MIVRNYLLGLLIAIPFVFVSPAAAQGRNKPSAKIDPATRTFPDVAADQAERADDAAGIIAKTPRVFSNEAKAIAVFPGVKKAAFGFGVRWGKGLISMRDENGRWIPPSFIEISGGSIGFQLGVQSTDLVLIFTNDDAVNSLLRAKLTLGGDASAAAGPLGRRAEAGVVIMMNSGILSFSHNKGLFAGISLEGAALSIDDSSNHRVYGNYINGDEILLDRRVYANDTVAPFIAALEEYHPGRLEAAGVCKTNIKAQ